MSHHLTQEQIREITGYTRPGPQERTLAEMGYIVLPKRNALNQVQALANHPMDPRFRASNEDPADDVVLNL